MADYEITLLSKAEDDKEAAKDLISKVGGEVTAERPLGQKSLAYPIKKERIASVTLLRFRMDPEQVLTLNKELLLSGQILRHMITTARAKMPAAAVLGKPHAAKTAETVEEVKKEPAEEVKPAKAAKKTREELKQEAQVAKDRQKKIEAELEKILSEE